MERPGLSKNWRNFMFALRWPEARCWDGKLAAFGEWRDGRERETCGTLPRHERGMKPHAQCDEELCDASDPGDGKTHLKKHLSPRQVETV